MKMRDGPKAGLVPDGQSEREGLYLQKGWGRKAESDSV